MMWIKYTDRRPEENEKYIITYNGRSWRVAEWIDESFYDVQRTPTGDKVYYISPPKYWAKVEMPCN